jgi:hypothetical protein
MSKSRGAVWSDADRLSYPFYTPDCANRGGGSSLVECNSLSFPVAPA